MAVSQSDSESSSVGLSPSARHLRNAWQTLNEFRHRGLFCDVILKVDNLRFPAHRLVLCTCSDYFRSLFLGRWNSSEKQEIDIPGITPSAMALLLNFAYTGKITVTSGNVEQLLPAADQFLVQQVKDKCCRFLENQLTINNCIATREYARKFFCSSLIKATTVYMLRNFEDLSKESEDFLHLDLQNFKALINDDRLNAKTEECVCEAVFRWVSHDRSNRLKDFTPLLKCVRLGLLDPEYFMTKVKGHAFVLESLPECRSIIREAMKVVCDLNSHEESLLSSHNQSANFLLRPRLPFEILLAIGGWSGGSPTNAIEAFDPRAETWLNASTLPDRRIPGQFRTISDLPCAYHGLVYFKGYIYVIGGFDGGNYFNTVRRMNVDTCEWIQEPCMLHKRCYVSVAVLGKYIYALGGMNGEKRLNSGERYNPGKKTWCDLPDMNEKRSDACATTLNGKIYIAGGFNGQECLFTAEYYDPVAMIWTRITPMRSRRSGVSLIGYHGLVYAVGGFDGVNRLRHAEAYSPITNSWKNISNMTSPRSNFGIEIIDGKLIVVGGYNGQRTTSDVEAYDDTTNEWYSVKDMHITRSGLSCCVVSGVSYDVIKKFCTPRQAIVEEISPSQMAISQTSVQSNDDGETSPYYTLSPPSGIESYDDALEESEHF